MRIKKNQELINQIEEEKKETKRPRWLVHFEPKEDITAYELALFLRYRWEETGEKFREDWENGAMLESLKKHIRVEITK